MYEDLLIRRLREAIRRQAALSPQERFDDMVRRGVIDGKGRVLKRVPQLPRRRKKAGPEDEHGASDA